MNQEIDFNSGDAGASDTIPIQAGSIKKGSHIVLKGYPCKVVEITTSKTGKHGHAKASITGVDIFTGKKYQDISPTSHNMMQPVVSRKEYQLVEIAEDNFVTLMDDEGNIREDLSIDIISDEIHKKIKSDFISNKNLTITVLKCMQKEKIMASKEILN
nr:translation initiation factor eIF-5A.2 [Cryptomonas curvata]